MFPRIKWSDLKDKITFKDSHPSWQLYEKFTIEEVDETQNHSLKDIPRSVLYESNRAKQLGKKHIFFSKTKDFGSEQEIVISGVTYRDLFEELTKTGKMDKKDHPRKGYFNISAVQILVKYLGVAGKDIPVKIAIKDERCIDPNQGIIGLISSNLYTGCFYSLLFMDYTFSAADENIEDILNIYVKTSVEMKKGSLSTAVSVRIYMSWTLEPHAFRKRDEVFSLNQTSKGQTCLLKTSGMAQEEIPKPVSEDKISWDLEFDFKNQNQNRRITSTSEIAYKLQTKEGVQIKLKEPKQPRLALSKAMSKEQSLSRFHKNLNETDDEDE